MNWYQFAEKTQNHEERIKRVFLMYVILKKYLEINTSN